jgi:hypothetical protein
VLLHPVLAVLVPGLCAHLLQQQLDFLEGFYVCGHVRLMCSGVETHASASQNRESSDIGRPCTRVYV